MPDFSDHYVSKIPWVAFRNASGQTIPPYSLVTASSWYTPDPSNTLGGPSLSPFFTAMQPGSDSYYSSNPSVNPYTLYITGREATPPAPSSGPNGMAARPDVYPQLVSLNGASGGSGQLAGPLSGSWSIAGGSAGFVMVGAPVGGLVPVKTLPGPYLGQSNQSIASGSSGPVDLWTGPKGAESDSQITFTCYNRFGLLAPGSWCLFDWIDQGWEIVELTTATIVRGALNDRLIKGGNTTMTITDNYGNAPNTIPFLRSWGSMGIPIRPERSCRPPGTARRNSGKLSSLCRKRCAARSSENWRAVGVRHARARTGSRTRFTRCWDSTAGASQRGHRSWPSSTTIRSNSK
jgi:hypothetical protein